MSSPQCERGGVRSPPVRSTSGSSDRPASAPFESVTDGTDEDRGSAVIARCARFAKGSVTIVDE